MNKQKINKIHYIYSDSLNTTHIGVSERPKNISHRKLRDPLNKAQINHKNCFLIEIKDNLPRKKEKIKENIPSHKNCSSNINVNNKIDNLNKINEQEKNLKRVIRTSNSFIDKKELKCCCCCCCCCMSFLYTPKKNQKNYE